MKTWILWSENLDTIALYWRVYRFAMFKNTVGAVKEKRVCAQPFYCAVLVFGKNQVVFDIPQ